MIRRSAFFLLVTLLTASLLWAQQGRSGRHGGPFGFDFSGPSRHGSHHPGFFHHRLGRGGFFFATPFFGSRVFGGSHFRVFPNRFAGDRVSGLRLADPDGHYFRAGPARAGFWSPGYDGYGWQHSVPSSSYSWVEEWRDRDPRQEEQAEEGFSFSDSLLLEEGMSKEDVMGLLGSPLRRIRMGSREVWRYSGYSLVFEQDALKEMR